MDVFRAKRASSHPRPALSEKANEVDVGGRYIPLLEEVAAKPCPSGGKWHVDLHTRWGAPLQAGCALYSYLSQSVFNVVLQKSIPTQIRQLIPHISNGQG